MTNTAMITQPTAQDDNHVSAVRAMLIDQMRAVRAATTPEALQIETTRTRAISQLAGAVTSLAKVEADYAHQAGNSGAVGFLESQQTPPGVSSPALGITVHRIR